MKKMLLASALVMFGTSAFAAQLKTCADDVQKRCGTLAAIAGMWSVDSNECAIVQAGTREDGSRFEEKVVFKDSNSVVSVELQSCTFSRADISGKFKEQKQVGGRLFNLTSDGQIVVIARNNLIVPLLNSKNKPYSSVADIKIDQQAKTVTLTFDNKQTLELGLDDVLAKLEKAARQQN